MLRLLTAAEPLIPIAVLADPTARLATLIHCFGWGSLIGLNIFLPMYLQSELGWSPTDAGLSLIILMATLNTSAGLTSQLIGRVKHYKALPTSVPLRRRSARCWRWLIRPSTMTPLKFEIILLLIGIGFGPTAPLTQVALQNTVAVHHLGAAIGTMSFCRTLVGTIIVAIFGAIVLAGVSGGTGTLSASATSIGAFVTVFLGVAGALTVTLVALILLEEKPLAEAMPATRT